MPTASMWLAILAIALAGTPSAVANQWIRIGPEGGIVTRLAADPQHPSTVYAATGGGVFKTVDAGANWTAVNFGLPAPDGIRILAADPQNAGTVYAASGNQVFRTTDGGGIWGEISTLPITTNLTVLRIAPSDPNTLYASGGAVIFKSADGGATWSHSGSAPGSLIAVDPQNPETLYAGDLSRIFKSTDGGVSWNPADSGLPPVQILAIDPQNPDTLYAGGQVHGPTAQIFKSADGGASWSPASRGLPSAPAPTAGYDLVLSIAVSPQTPSVIYALIFHAAGNTYDLFLATSTDRAASWTLAAIPPLRAIDPIDLITQTSGLTPDPQTPGTLYLGTTGGVLKTTDAGGHWDFANSGMLALPVASLLIDPLSGTLLAGKSMDNPLPPGPALFKSTDSGESWVAAGIGLPLRVGLPVTDPQDPSHLYLLGLHALNGTGLFQSRDKGESWAEIWSNTSPTWGSPFAIDPQNPNIMYAAFCSVTCDPKISKSTDGGHTWTELRFPLWTETEYPLQAGCCPWVSALAADPQNPDIVYAGTSSDGYGLGGDLWKSEDGGVSWANLNLGFGNFSSITIDPRKPGTIYVAAPILRSTDGGRTWVKSQDGICGLFVLDPKNSDTLYCAGGDKVFRSSDAGANWIPVGPGLVGSVNSLTIDPRNPTILYAGTTAGLFVIKVSELRRPDRPVR